MNRFHQHCVKDDLSPAERATWRKVVEEIKHG